MQDLFAGKVLAEKLARAVGLLDKVVDQTDRRVFKGEKVPASEKVVSFFEDHTDVIVKTPGFGKPGVGTSSTRISFWPCHTAAFIISAIVFLPFSGRSGAHAPE